MKKIFAILIITMVTFSVTGCEMDENSMGMLLSFMGGLSGYSGTAFNTTGGTGGQQWAQAGSQIHGMWMSQSENNQEGRNMTSMLQANQIALDYSASQNKKTSTQSSTSKTTSGSKPTEKKSNWDKLLDKGKDKFQDPKNIVLLSEKFQSYKDKK